MREYEGVSHTPRIIVATITVTPWVSVCIALISAHGIDLGEPLGVNRAVGFFCLG